MWLIGATVVDGTGRDPQPDRAVLVEDGRIAAVGGDHLIISDDDGRTWTNIGEPLPYPPAGLTYSPSARAFFIWRNDCKDLVLPDAVMSAGFWVG